VIVLSYRPALISDATLLWRWRNDPMTRANSFTQSPVGWQEHRAWLTRKLESSAAQLCWLLVVEQDGQPAAIVRFDREEDGAEVSITVAPECRGAGIGADALRIAIDGLFAQIASLRKIVAYIKADNQASVKVFERASFVCCGPSLQHGEAALRYERYRTD
jgi:RimJ/RimL family protein N-acetyltransferase